MNKYITRLMAVIACTLCNIGMMAMSVSATAQNDSTELALRSDSAIVRQLRAVGVNFSNDNAVTLLMSGQEKFDDMFHAIRQAKSSIHLEYFNFRNDSIASLLFDILAEKHSKVLRCVPSSMGLATLEQSALAETPPHQLARPRHTNIRV